MAKLRVKAPTVETKDITPKASTVAKDKPPKEKTASKYVGVSVINGERLRVAQYQDYTFATNDNKGRRLTDAELAADWRREFPNAVEFTTFHVAGARRDFNKGIHSKAYPGAHDSRAWFLDAKGGKTQTAPKAEEPEAKAKEVKGSTAKAQHAEAAENPKGKVARKKTAA